MPEHILPKRRSGTLSAWLVPTPPCKEDGMRAFTRPKLLAWAGVSLALGITAIAAALYSGSPVAGPAIAPAADPGIKVWDASDGKKEP